MKMKYLVLFIFLFVGLTVFSQEQSNVVVFRPKKNFQQGDLEKEIVAQKNEIKNSGFFTSFSKYLALKNENLALCNSEDCKEEVQNLLSMRYVAEGRCMEVKNTLDKRVCLALKNNNSQDLFGQEKDIYKGLVNGDSETLLRAVNAPQLSQNMGGQAGKNDILEMLGIYYGFKYYSSVACERYLKDKGCPLSKKVSCQIIFSQDSEKVIDNILRNLAIFELAKKQANPDLCNLISNREIKGACLNSRIKRLENFW